MKNLCVQFSRRFTTILQALKRQQFRMFYGKLNWLEVKGYIFFLVLPAYCYQPISLYPHACVLSHVTLWTAARQGPLSMDFPGKTTGAGCYFLLHKGIFLAYNQPLSFPLMPVGSWQAQVQVGVRVSEGQESYQEGLIGKIICLALPFFILYPASDP